MLFELHTALYWKANKKYAASQGIKPQFEVESTSDSATAVSDLYINFYQKGHFNIIIEISYILSSHEIIDLFS